MSALTEHIAGRLHEEGVTVPVSAITVTDVEMTGPPKDSHQTPYHEEWEITYTYEIGEQIETRVLAFNGGELNVGRLLVLEALNA